MLKINREAKMSKRKEPKNNKRSLSIVDRGIESYAYIKNRMEKLKKPSDDLWAINRMGLILPEVDLIIAMDDRRRVDRDWEGAATKLDILEIPTLTSKKYPEYKNSFAFPLEEWKSLMVNTNSYGGAGKFSFGEADSYGGAGEFGLRCLTNSLCYALAYAYMKGYKDIDFYGGRFNDIQEEIVPCENKKHPTWHQFYEKENLQKIQEPGTEGFNFLLGFLIARGILIRIYCAAKVMPYGHTFLYGYDDDQRSTE